METTSQWHEYIQIEYLERISKSSNKSNVNNEIVMSSINGMAAAMQTTG